VPSAGSRSQWERRVAAQRREAERQAKERERRSLPPWSPPLKGGSTGGHSAAIGQQLLAAMEPAVGRREHR
jgi:hypothetical protein